MERESLNQILERLRDENRVSSQNIRKITEEFLEKPLRELVNLRDGKNECMSLTEWESLFTMWMGQEPGNESLKKRFQTLKENSQMFPVHSELFLFLISLGVFCVSKTRTFFNMPVEEYLKDAGMEKEFDQWFSEDVRKYEELEGKAPSLLNVLDICFNQYSEANGRLFFFLIFMENNIKEFGHPVNPFFRSRFEMGAYHYKDRLIRLIAKWTWILVVEAPLKIVSKKYD